MNNNIKHKLGLTLIMISYMILGSALTLAMLNVYNQLSTLMGIISFPIVLIGLCLEECVENKKSNHETNTFKN